MLQDRMEWKISVERVHTQKKMAAAHKSRAPHTTNKKGPQKKIKSNEIDDRSGTYSQRYGLLMFNGTCFFCASAPFSFFSFSFFCFLLKYYFTTATMDDAGRTLFFFLARVECCDGVVFFFFFFDAKARVSFMAVSFFFKFFVLSGVVGGNV